MICLLSVPLCVHNKRKTYHENNVELSSVVIGSFASHRQREELTHPLLSAPACIKGNRVMRLLLLPFPRDAHPGPKWDWLSQTGKEYLLHSLHRTRWRFFPSPVAWTALDRRRCLPYCVKQFAQLLSFSRVLVPRELSALAARSSLPAFITECWKQDGFRIPAINTQIR